MFAIASNSSSSASEPSHSYNYHSSNRDQRHYQASRPQDPDDDYFQRNNNDGDDNLSQRKDPPRYDSRPNLKNDLSDSYQPYEESNKATHVRSHYEDNDVNNHNLHHHHSQPQRYEASTPIRSTNHATAPIHHNNTSTQPETPSSTAHSTHKPAPVSTDPRPSPRAGQPPASTTLPVSPGLPSRTLGSRGLLLGRSKNRAEHRRRTQQHHQQQHYASLAAATMPPPSPGSNPSLGSGSHDYSHSYNSNRVSPAIHDPGPLQGLSKTITVECTECGELIQHVAKNAIALECPSCQKFYPTVTCRVVQ